MAAEGGGVPSPQGSRGAPEPPLPVTVAGDGGVLDHVRNTDAGLGNPRIEKGRRGSTPTAPGSAAARRPLIPALLSPASPAV